MQAVIILNPAADHGRARKLTKQLLTWGSRYADLDLWLTERRGHERTLAERAVEAGYELIIAAGGDGTVHHVVNGLVHGGKPRATLGIIPIGSGNDFAYGLNLLAKPEIALQTIFTGERRLVDLARLEDDRGLYKIVTNSIGIGFDATVTIESQNITRVHGFAMYTLAALRTIALYFQTPRLQINFDDELIIQQALLLAIGLGPRAG
ncbi:MAG: diacylglycerol kinase family protein, partial [Candidatus Promineifilaceae bacterium]|nr:diacylglycerol kinase family protein [Candidatus Promineifilaceae bacterium]